MKVKEVEIKYGVTVNLDNFESERIDFAIRAELDPNETEETAFNAKFPYLKNKVNSVASKESFQSTLTRLIKPGT